MMLFYKRYPTKGDYENVAQEIAGKYPFLKSPLDPAVSYDSSIESIIQLHAVYSGVLSTLVCKTIT